MMFSWENEHGVIITAAFEEVSWLSVCRQRDHFLHFRRSIAFLMSRSSILILYKSPSLSSEVSFV